MTMDLDWISDTKKTDSRRFIDAHLEVIGTRGRTWTGTVSPPADFESAASTNFATLAQIDVLWLRNSQVANYNDVIEADKRFLVILQ